LLAVSQDTQNSVRVWSIPDGGVVLSPELAGYSDAFWSADAMTLVTGTTPGPGRPFHWRSWSLDTKEPTSLGTTPTEPGDYFSVWRGRVDPQQMRFLTLRGNTIRVTALDRIEEQPQGEVLAELDTRVRNASFDGSGDYVASIDGSGKIQLWPAKPGLAEQARTIGEHPGAWCLRFGPSDSILATGTSDDGTICLWDLNGPPAADPIVVRLPGNQINDIAIHPSGRWLVQGGAGNQRFWPLTREYPRTLRGHDGFVSDLYFDAGGKWLASKAFDGSLRVWSLSPDTEDLARVHQRGGYSMAMDGTGETVLVGGVGFCRLLHRDDASLIRELGTEEVFESISGVVHFVAMTPDGRLAAASGSWDQDGAIAVWDLDADRFWILDAGDSTSANVEFTSDGKLLAWGDNGLRLWDVEARTHEVLSEGDVSDVDASADGQIILSVESSGAIIIDRSTGKTLELTEHQGQFCGAIDPAGEWIATGNWGSGEIRYGSTRGGAVHLLTKHAKVGSLAFDTQGRWIASGGMDGTIRLWPIPEGQPFHTLPHDEFLERLRSLTTIRVVADDAGGYEFEWEDFPGWTMAPTW
jgi:WD40 repeat protein